MKKNQLTILLFFIFGLFCNTLSAQKPTIYIYNDTGNFSPVEGSPVSLRLYISGAIATQIVVNVTTTSGTAAGSDFTALSTTIIIPAGQTRSEFFSVDTSNDAISESNENFTVNAVAVSGNTSNIKNQRTITILDNDTIPTVTVSPQSMPTEGLGAATMFYNLSRPYNSNVVINCVTATGTAGASDFTAENSIITIPAGQTVASKTISITNDALIESDETFVVNSTVITGNTTNTLVTTTITIIDNDTKPTFTVYNAQVSEGQTVSAFVVLNRVYNSNIVVNFVTATGTAGTSDYSTTNITQTILPGNLSASVSIPTTNDSLDEPVEIFYINATVTSGNTTNTTGTCEVRIFDNDGLPDLSVFHYNDDNQAQGGDGGNYEGDLFNFFISLSAPNVADTVIHIVTSPGTASNSDFTPIDTMITIPAGEIYTEINVPTTLDNILEGTENFNFTATVTSGNTYISSISTVVDILDNYNIKTTPDEFMFVAGMGTNLSVIANDLFHGAAVNPSDVSITLDADTNTIGATMNAQGILTIPNSVPQGFYYLYYTACEVAHPGICDSAYISLQVKSPLTLTYFSSFADTNGDGYTSAGDTLNIAFTLINNGNAPITNILPNTSYPGNINYSGGIASLVPGASNNTSITSQIIITQENINSGGANFIAQFVGNYYSNTVEIGTDDVLGINPSDGIRLRTFVDSNNNGVQDGIEPDFRYGNFDYSINSGVVHNVYCTPSHYLYESNPTSIYNLSYNVDAPYATYNLCPTVYPNVTVASGSGITTYNFPIATTPYQDSSAYLIPFSSPRPGVVWNNYIIYGNHSNQPMTSGTVTYTKDPLVSITNVSESGATTTANGFTFNFTNLAPYETRYMSVELLVPSIPTVSLNQLLTNSVSITMPSGDIYPYNNNSSLSQAIVGSFDPNDITESHGEKILHSSFTSNDYLTYTIRFENTGNASAINIRIEDILNDKLNPATIRMIDASDSYSLERIGTKLTWKLNGINLPPSIAGTRIGKGYITFQIKPKAGYAVGDVIPSQASIYFDTNPAVVTDVFNTKFVNTLANEEFVFSNFSYYPNPVKNVLTIANDSVIDNVSVVSILGQQVLVKKVNDLQAEIDMNSLSNGVYFVKVSSGGSEKTIKVLKQ